MGLIWLRFHCWSSQYYSNALLLKEDLLGKIGYDRPPHFNKYLVPRYYPGYDEYLILDDDILFSKNAPAFTEKGADSFLIAIDPIERYCRCTICSI